MRLPATAVLFVLLSSPPLTAQARDTTGVDKTFMTRGDLGIAGAALGGAVLLSRWDVKVARASQKGRVMGEGMDATWLGISKVNETTLTVAGILTYGIGRLTKQRTVTDIALHATESVVLASVVSQLIRGPLGRSRPFVSHDSDQYDFKFGGGFQKGKPGFDRRAFPSIHTSSSMAVATVLAMELHRRRPAATPYAAPIIFAAGILPGVARIQLDQHWASDVAAGAFMGAFAAYKVVSYSHDHPGNRFDRVLLKASVMPDVDGRWRIGFSPEF